MFQHQAITPTRPIMSSNNTNDDHHNHQQVGRRHRPLEVEENEDSTTTTPTTQPRMHKSHQHQNQRHHHHHHQHHNHHRHHHHHLHHHHHHLLLHRHNHRHLKLIKIPHKLVTLLLLISSSLVVVILCKPNNQQLQQQHSLDKQLFRKALDDQQRSSDNLGGGGGGGGGSSTSSIGAGANRAGGDGASGQAFSCPEQFGYYTDTKDCTKYYVCVFGEVLHESCTGGLRFSRELQTCDWPRNVECPNQQAANDSSTPQTTVPTAITTTITTTTTNLPTSSSTTTPASPTTTSLVATTTTTMTAAAENNNNNNNNINNNNGQRMKAPSSMVFADEGQDPQQPSFDEAVSPVITADGAIHLHDGSGGTFSLTPNHNRALQASSPQSGGIDLNQNFNQRHHHNQQQPQSSTASQSVAHPQNVNVFVKPLAITRQESNNNNKLASLRQQLAPTNVAIGQQQSVRDRSNNQVANQPATRSNQFTSSNSDTGRVARPIVRLENGAAGGDNTNSNSESDNNDNVAELNDNGPGGNTNNNNNNEFSSANSNSNADDENNSNNNSNANDDPSPVTDDSDELPPPPPTDQSLSSINLQADQDSNENGGNNNPFDSTTTATTGARDFNGNNNNNDNNNFPLTLSSSSPAYIPPVTTRNSNSNNNNNNLQPSRQSSQLISINNRQIVDPARQTFKPILHNLTPNSQLTLVSSSNNFNNNNNKPRQQLDNRNNQLAPISNNRQINQLNGNNINNNNSSALKLSSMQLNNAQTNRQSRTMNFNNQALQQPTIGNNNSSSSSSKQLIRMQTSQISNQNNNNNNNINQFEPIQAPSGTSSFKPRFPNPMSSSSAARSQDVLFSPAQPFGFGAANGGNQFINNNNNIPHEQFGHLSPLGGGGGSGIQAAPRPNDNNNNNLQAPTFGPSQQRRPRPPKRQQIPTGAGGAGLAGETTGRRPVGNVNQLIDFETTTSRLPSGMDDGGRSTGVDSAISSSSFPLPPTPTRQQPPASARQLPTWPTSTTSINFQDQSGESFVTKPTTTTTAANNQQQQIGAIQNRQRLTHLGGGGADATPALPLPATASTSTTAAAARQQQQQQQARVQSTTAVGGGGSSASLHQRQAKPVQVANNNWPPPPNGGDGLAAPLAPVSGGGGDQLLSVAINAIGGTNQQSTSGQTSPTTGQQVAATTAATAAAAAGASDQQQDPQLVANRYLNSAIDALEAGQPFGTVDYDFDILNDNSTERRPNGSGGANLNGPNQAAAAGRQPTTTTTTTTANQRTIAKQQSTTTTTINHSNNNNQQATLSTTSSNQPATTKKPRPTNKKIQINHEQAIANNRASTEPARRPEPVFGTPQPLQTAVKCDPRTCRLPDCKCGDTLTPGGLEAKNTPQVVLLTFDDAVNDLNWEIYEELFSGRVNPNGCPILATFYVSHEWTDYGQVQTLYSRGHEMASHSVTHSFGEKFSKSQWFKEINGQREILNMYGGVKMNDVRGMRAPFLQIGGNKMFEMLYDANFTYDSSMPIFENSPPMWPYTLDYQLAHECMITPCPTKSFPGVWEVGMTMWVDLRGGRCSMGDACSNPSDEDGVYEMLMKNFNRHYKSNRAPFGLFYHSAWFNTVHHRRGFLRFLATVNSYPEVFFVTNWQMLQWMRQPTPLSEINSFEPWQCPTKNDRPPPCYHPSVCNVKSEHGTRFMKTCQPCPANQQYPWVGATGFKGKQAAGGSG